MRETILNSFTKQEAKYTPYYHKKVSALPTFSIEQHVYVDRPPLSLIAEDKKISTQNNKLLLRTTGPRTVMDMKVHVITVDGNRLSDSKFTDKATPVPISDQVATRIIPRLEPSARTTAPRNIDTKCKEPPEKVVDKVVDHPQTSKNVV